VTTPQNFEHFEMVPYQNLFRSHLNVRQYIESQAIRNLAELIFVEGVLQNLVGYKEGAKGSGKAKRGGKAKSNKESEKVGVVAGGCRYLAIGLLIDEVVCHRIT